MIPLVDLKKQYRSIKKEIDGAIQNVINDSAFTDGPYVEKFEKHFAKFVGTKHAICLNSGTSALHLALYVLPIARGDEVILPVNTFIATAWAVSYLGAKPVFVDCTKDTWQIDASQIEARVSKKTKAVIGVHLFGQPFDIDAVMKITRKYNLFLIEDCAQAHGARYKGKRVGTFGDMGCFSFYPSKNLGAYGEGGAVVTNTATFANRIRMLRNHGSKEKYHHEEIGFNMRMEGIQAAVLDVKLKHLKSWNKRKQLIAQKFQTAIKNPLVTIQYQPAWGRSVYYVFVVTVPRRKRFMSYLETHGIHSSIHYPIPCHLQKAYEHLGYKKGDFPVAEHFSDHCVSIPLYPEMTDKEIEKVINTVNSYEE